LRVGTRTAPPRLICPAKTYAEGAATGDVAYGLTSTAAFPIEGPAASLPLLLLLDDEDDDDIRGGGAGLDLTKEEPEKKNAGSDFSD